MTKALKTNEVFMVAALSNILIQFKNLSKRTEQGDHFIYFF